MEKIYRQTLLFDFYGELLTERQRTLFEEVVFDDCSLGEVAERHGVSRQSVHDMVRRVTRALEEYEEKLGLVNKFLDLKKKVSRIKELSEDERIRQLADEIMEEL
ncbi:MAG: DNA-binding protein [Lachnospiraceae bacterium]|nr:DNA-binding protein [Lachnospiraceae bacterium]